MSFSHIYPAPEGDWSGTYSYTIEEGNFSLKPQESNVSKGHSLGLRFKLEELSLQDNIDLASVSYWQRKIDLTRASNTAVDYDDENYLVILAAAMDINREGGVLDILQTSTSKFYESLETLLTASDSGTIYLNNVDSSNTSDTPGNSVSVFDGTGIADSVDWANPEDFDNFKIRSLRGSEFLGVNSLEFP